MPIGADPIPILLLVDGLDIGGSERQVVELLKGLRMSGRFAAVLGVLDRGGGFEAEAAALAAGVLRLRRRARFDCTPALALPFQARRAGVRLIHAAGWMSGMAALPAARCLGLPVLNGTLRGPTGRLHARDRVSLWCALRSHALVANTRAQIDALGLGRDPRARVIANGVDLGRFERVVAESGGGEAEICMVANFNRHKDHPAMIRAAARIREAVPGARLTLVGRDGGTLAEARRLVGELGVDGSVRFVTDGRRPEPIVAASAVCVLSTLGEGLPNAVIEYMAFRKPVVATACAGNALLVRDGENGFLVPLASPEALAARVIELLRDPERARGMGAAGRRIVEAGYSLERMIAEYEGLYDELLARRV